MSCSPDPVAPTSPSGPRRGQRFVVLLLAAALGLPAGASAIDGESLYDNVASALLEDFHDESFRRDELPALIEKHRERSREALTVEEQRAVAWDLLAEIEVSHLGLLSVDSFRRLMGELQNEHQLMLGFELLELDGKHFVHNLYEGGPAERAGVLRGDRVVEIDGVSTEDSARLDYRTDDAALPDPPLRALLVDDGAPVRLRVERRIGEELDVEVTPAEYSAFEAAKASVRTFEHSGKKIGYIHFWYAHLEGVPGLLDAALSGELAGVDGLVFDLRGRGGSPYVVGPIVKTLKAFDGTVVALTDRHSRSAKDVIAHEIKRQEVAVLIGEPTAGAVIPATFRPVGHDTVLMFPSFTLGRYTDLLEGDPVEPDIEVELHTPYLAGRDPILERGIAYAATGR